MAGYSKVPDKESALKPVNGSGIDIKATPPRASVSGGGGGFFDSLKSRSSPSSNDEAARVKSLATTGLVRIPLPLRSTLQAVLQSHQPANAKPNAAPAPVVGAAANVEPLLYLLPLEASSTKANAWIPVKANGKVFDPISAHLKRHHPPSAPPAAPPASQPVGAARTSVVSAAGRPVATPAPTIAALPSAAAAAAPVPAPAAAAVMGHRLVVFTQQRCTGDDQIGAAQRIEFGDGTSLDGIMQVCAAAVGWWVAEPTVAVVIAATEDVHARIVACMLCYTGCVSSASDGFVSYHTTVSNRVVASYKNYKLKPSEKRFFSDFTIVTGSAAKLAAANKPAGAPFTVPRLLLKELIIHKVPALDLAIDEMPDGTPATVHIIRLVVTIVQRDTFLWSSLQAGKGVLTISSDPKQPVTVTLPVGCVLSGGAVLKAYHMPGENEDPIRRTLFTIDLHSSVAAHGVGGPATNPPRKNYLMLEREEVEVAASDVHKNFRIELNFDEPPPLPAPGSELKTTPSKRAPPPEHKTPAAAAGDRKHAPAAVDRKQPVSAAAAFSAGTFAALPPDSSLPASVLAATVAPAASRAGNSAISPPAPIHIHRHSHQHVHQHIHLTPTHAGSAAAAAAAAAAAVAAVDPDSAASPASPLTPISALSPITPPAAAGASGIASTTTTTTTVATTVSAAPAAGAAAVAQPLASASGSTAAATVPADPAAAALAASLARKAARREQRSVLLALALQEQYDLEAAGVDPAVIQVAMQRYFPPSTSSSSSHRSSSHRSSRRTHGSSTATAGASAGGVIVAPGTTVSGSSRSHRSHRSSRHGTSSSSSSSAAPAQPLSADTLAALAAAGLVAPPPSGAPGASGVAQPIASASTSASASGAVVDTKIDAPPARPTIVPSGTPTVVVTPSPESGGVVVAGMPAPLSPQLVSSLAAAFAQSLREQQPQSQAAASSGSAPAPSSSGTATTRVSGSASTHRSGSQHRSSSSRHAHSSVLLPPINSSSQHSPASTTSSIRSGSSNSSASPSPLTPYSHRVPAPAPSAVPAAAATTVAATTVAATTSVQSSAAVPVTATIAPTIAATIANNPTGSITATAAAASATPTPAAANATPSAGAMDDVAYARHLQRQLDDEARQARHDARAQAAQQHAAQAVAAMAQAQGNLDFDSMDYQTLLDFQDYMSRQAPAMVPATPPQHAAPAAAVVIGSGQSAAAAAVASQRQQHHIHHQHAVGAGAGGAGAGILALQAHHSHHHSRRAGGASVAQISALPDFKVNASSALLDQECLVCRQSFEVAEVAKTLPCLHQYHSTCIDQWLLLKSHCPVCKTAINQ